MRKGIGLLICLILAVLCCSALAEAYPYVDIFPRQSMAVGGSLDFAYEDFDRSVDQYAHILREEADGTYTVAAAMKVWDAAAETGTGRIEPGMVTEPGLYWLTLGPDPDYAGTDEEKVVSLSFKALEDQLATPVIENIITGRVVGTDVSFDVPIPEGAELVYCVLGWMDNGVFRPEWWDNSGSHFNALGVCTTRPGTYQLRVSAHPQWFGEPASETVADSDTAVYEFTLAPGEIPRCPEPSLSITEADYEPDRNYEVSYTVPGAEAVACTYGVVNPANPDYDGGTGLPNTCTPGNTGSTRTDMGPGEYHLFCYGRFNGIWSTPGEAVFTLNPIGYMDIPAVAWQDSPVENALQVSTADPLVFTAACDNAETIACEIKKNTSDGLSEWIDWIEYPVEESGPATADLNDLGLESGTYQLRFIPFRDGWLESGYKTVEVTVTGQP